MSNYADFVGDFPNRCAEVLTSYEYRARLMGREVTLLLAVATSGFTIPFERLRPRGADDPPHPAGDRDKYPEARIKLDTLLENNRFFLGSELWGSNPVSWLAGEVTRVTDDPDLWPELATKPKPMSKTKTIKAVLGTLRNALAHGNIYTRGSSSAIDQIVFVSRVGDTGKYNFIAVSPEDFRAFLSRWFAFLKSLQLPGRVALEVVEYAL